MNMNLQGEKMKTSKLILKRNRVLGIVMLLLLGHWVYNSRQGCRLQQAGNTGYPCQNTADGVEQF
jgi:hypothetical protein